MTADETTTRVTIILAMELTIRLKEIRDSFEYSQRNMSKSVGVSVGTWQAYEAGTSIPGGKVLEAIAKLGFNVNWLLTGEGPMYFPAEERKRLLHKELIEKLKKSLLDMGITALSGGCSSGGIITHEEAKSFLRGDFVPSTEQLMELCRIAGQPFKEKEFIDAILNSEPLPTPKKNDLDDKLLALVFEVVDDIDRDEQALSPEQKAELASLVYFMNQGSKYTKPRLLRFVEAICVFIEQGVKFNDIQDMEMSNIIREVAHHVVKGGED